MFGGKHQSQEVEGGVEDDFGGKSLASSEIFSNGTIELGSVARQVDGVFIVQLNCRRISVLLPSKT